VTTVSNKAEPSGSNVHYQIAGSHCVIRHSLCDKREVMAVLASLAMRMQPFEGLDGKEPAAEDAVMLYLIRGRACPVQPRERGLTSGGMAVLGTMLERSNHGRWETGGDRR
jgi:hypothetical protein